MNKFKLIKNDNIKINIDKKILPLFSVPVLLKNLNIKKRNKYNIINPDHKLIYKIISFKEIIEIFLKGLNLYNYHLNEYLKKHNKLYLILELKNAEYYKFNIRISNYFYIINRFMPVFNLRSLIYNLRLYLPKEITKSYPHIRYSYRFRNVAKIYSEELIYKTKKEKKKYRLEIKKLLEKGNEFINEINNKINEKKNLIIKKKIEQNNKIKLNNSINSLLDNNNNNNNNLITDSSLNIQISSINLSDKESFNLITTNDKIINSFEIIKNNKNLFNSVINNKSNKIKMAQTINSILKNQNHAFDYKTDPISVNSNPVTLFYYNYINNNSTYNNNINKKPIINHYLKSMSIYNMRNIGVIMSYSNIISFNFNTQNNKLIKNIYNLLAASFKSMYCLISKPVFILKPDIIIIQLFYYLFIPNVLKLKKIHNYSNNIKLNKNRWLTRKKKKKKKRGPLKGGGVTKKKKKKNKKKGKRGVCVRWSKEKSTSHINKKKK